MSQPSGYPNSTTMPSGQENSPLGPSALPNGQPSQWSRPPIFPLPAKLQRPVTSTQNFQYPTSALATNGIQMPNPGSLSSQSSRDPSPAPPLPPSLSHSTPNLASVNSINPPLVQRAPHLADNAVLNKHGGSQPLQQHSRPMATVSPNGMTPVSRYTGGLQQLSPPAANMTSSVVDQRNESGRGDQNNHSVSNKHQTKVNGIPVSAQGPQSVQPPPIIRTNAQGTVPLRQESLLVGQGQEQTLNQFQNNLSFQQTERIQQQQPINTNTVTQYPSFNANRWQQTNSGVQAVSSVSSQNNNLYTSQSAAATYQPMTIQHPPTYVSSQHNQASVNQPPLGYHAMPANTYQSNSSQQNPQATYMNQSQTSNQLSPLNSQQPLSNQAVHTQPTPTSLPSQMGNVTHSNSQQMTPGIQQQYPAIQRNHQFTPTSSPRPPGPYSGYNNQPPLDSSRQPVWNTPAGDNISQSQQGNAQHMSQRYPQQVNLQGPPTIGGLTTQMSGLSVTQTGFNKLWGHDACDLLQNRNILPPEKIEAPRVKLNQEFLDSVNCSPDIFRCTLTKIPENNSLLQKSRLPLGILIHPFRDLNHLAVIQCSTIVRCRSCRTYINPFVYFVDHKRWKCNLCFRANELPEEFQYDPVSKSFGDPSRRPEIKSSTIEFIAPSEYMLRPPQPAVYLFVLDVSSIAVESGYLGLLCSVLLEEIDRLPGDGRTQIGFITFDSSVHFYNMAEGLSQPQQMVVVDIEDIFLPCPDNLLVNLAESRELVKDLLQQLPQKFAASHDNVSALGAALQAAYKLMSPTGGRVTVFQACLPNSGPGSLTIREDPSQRAGKEAPHLNPATDFYKRLALDCSGQQIAVDLFLVNGQYSDLATLSGIARFSGGCIHHFPLFKKTNELQAESLQRTIKRYLSRKIGFEAVMRIRCSRGLAIHTFHGNFFVRSTDLLSLPNVNPDAGFGMQISVEESLSDLQTVCFQAALLYTSSKGERRIRVHTLCLPVANTLSDILHSADQQCIIGLLGKMAVDRSHQTSLSDARDAFINVAIDVLSAYRLAQGSAASGGLVAPINLRLLPLYILALLKYTAFRTGQSTRLDDRLFAMCQMKTLPLTMLIKTIYPDLYPVHNLTEQNTLQVEGEVIPQAPRLHLSAEKLDFRGAFLMDTGEHLMIYIGRNIATEFCCNVLGVQAFNLISDSMYELPELETPDSERLRKFINHLQSEKPFPATLQIIRDDSQHRSKFLERLIEDRTESAMSYYEFLQHLKSNIK